MPEDQRICEEQRPRFRFDKIMEPELTGLTLKGKKWRVLSKANGLVHACVPITMTTDTGPENGSARGCLNGRSLYKIRQRSEKWIEAAGRLEGLSCLLGVEISQSLLRRQTKLQVNKEKGKRQETEENKSFVLSQRLQPNQSNSQGSQHPVIWVFLMHRVLLFLALLFFVSSVVNGNEVKKWERQVIIVWGRLFGPESPEPLKCRALSSSTQT